MSTAINIGIVPAPALCRVPEGAQIVEMKYCELCGRSFPRRWQDYEFIELKLKRDYRYPGTGGQVRIKRDTGERICRGCASKPLPELRAEELLKDQENYKDQLPDLNKLHRSVHPIRYDRRIANLSARVGRSKNTREEIETWHKAVRDKFAASKEPLTLEQVYELIPNCFSPTEAYMRLRWNKFSLRKVGSLKSKTGEGQGPRLYLLEGVSPETIQ
jgi:hypothetical protein